MEFSVILPVLALLVFGSIEASHAIQLKQGLTVTCYEATVIATSPRSTHSKMMERARSVAEAFQIRDLQVTATPAITADLEEGTVVTVTVSAPMRSNRIGPNFFFTNRTLSVRSVMVRL